MNEGRILASNKTASVYPAGSITLWLCTLRAGWVMHSPAILPGVHVVIWSSLVAVKQPAAVAWKICFENPSRVWNMQASPPPLCSALVWEQIWRRGCYLATSGSKAWFFFFLPTRNYSVSGKGRGQWALLCAGQFVLKGKKPGGGWAWGGQPAGSPSRPGSQSLQPPPSAGIWLYIARPGAGKVCLPPSILKLILGKSLDRMVLEVV